MMGSVSDEEEESQFDSTFFDNKNSKGAELGPECLNLVGRGENWVASRR